MTLTPDPAARHVLLVFLDGVGLGDDNPAINPFAAANTPTLDRLADGKRWLRSTGVQISETIAFIPTDPRLGVPGRPQSASGQAAILTGRNIPQLIGEHYGPRPNPPVRALLAEDNLFMQVAAHGLRSALLEAYPPMWHAAVNSGKRLLSSYQQALANADGRLFTIEDLDRGDALAVDWTGEGWRSELGLMNSPIYTPDDAGRLMVTLSRRYHFSMFSHWITDVVGHRGALADGVSLIEQIDRIMASALAAWQDDEGLLIITSDHGNLEDLSHTKHTENDVPTVIVGRGAGDFARGIHTLADITPGIADYLFASPATAV